MFGLRAVIDRCGVIAGPWQMGRVDQGVFTHWMLCHHFGLPLAYIGYGGKGKQVRDLLHVDDLVDLIELQLLEPDRWDGMTFNVGGGREAASRCARPRFACQEITGNEVPIEPVLDERPGDVRVYLSDCASLFDHTAWRPRRSAHRILEDIHDWIVSDRELIARALGIGSAGRPRAAGIGGGSLLAHHAPPASKPTAPTAITMGTERRRPSVLTAARRSRNGAPPVAGIPRKRSRGQPRAARAATVETSGRPEAPPRLRSRTQVAPRPTGNPSAKRATSTSAEAPGRALSITSPGPSVSPVAPVGVAATV